MYRLISSMVFLFIWVYPCKAIPFEKEVWKRFYQLVNRPTSEQLSGFQVLQQELLKRGLTTDSTYTNLLFLYAGAYATNQELDKSISLLDEAIQIVEKHPLGTPIPYQSKYHFYLGNYQAQRNLLDIAIRHYRKAYELGIRQYNKWGIPALACRALAHLYYEIQDYERGLQYASLAHEIDQQTGDMGGLTKDLYEQCILLSEQDSFSSSFFNSKLDSLVAYAEYYSNEYERSVYYTFLGGISLKKQDYTACYKWHDRAIDLLKRNHWQADLQDIYITLNYVSELQGDTLRANKYLALISPEQLNPYSRSKLYNNQAFALIKRGEKQEEAVRKLNKSLQVIIPSYSAKNAWDNPVSADLKKLPQKDYAFAPLLDKAGVLSSDKKNSKKLSYALKTYLLLDTLIDYIRWQHQGITTKLFWRERLQDLYEEALETCFQLRDLEHTCYFLEKSRAVLLLDQLNSQVAQAFLPRAEAEQEDALRIRANQYETDDVHLRDFLQAQGQLDEYVSDLEKRYPLYYEYKYNSQTPSIAEIQRYLGHNGQCFLSYYEGEKGIYFLLVSREEAVLKKLDAQSYHSCKQQLQTFFHTPKFFNQQFGSYLQASSTFYKLTLAPLEAHLKPRIIISASGPPIPFAALSRSAEHMDYLLHSYAFSYTYSARILLNQTPLANRKKDQPYFLGIAPIHFPYRPNLVSLKASKLALEQNRELFHSSQLLTGYAASKSAFEDKWPQASVVQLITHASTGREFDQPLLYLADTCLSLKDISYTHVCTQLLLLSACQTGIGKDHRGEGVFSLSRGFLATGIPSIFSTLWDVRDQDAYALSQAILNQASRGFPLDIALQKAQLNWLTQKSKSQQLPDTWAGIILLGSSTALTPETDNCSWIYGGIILCLWLTGIMIPYFIRKNRVKNNQIDRQAPSIKKLEKNRFTN